MLTTLGRHLRTNVVAYLALVLALGGTSYAAVQLQAGQVQKKHLAASAVTSSKVKNGTLKRKDLKPDVIRDSEVLLAEVVNGKDPAPHESVRSTRAVTLDRAGTVLVRWASPGRSVGCTNGGPVAALYVDGVGVPKSGADVAPIGSGDRAVEVVAELTLSKGSHTLVVGEYCLGEGTWQVGQDSGDETWTVLLLS